MEISGESLTGANVDGLRIRAPFTQVHALAITGFSGDGIELFTNVDDSTQQALIASNYLGISPDQQVRGNKGSGLRLNRSASNTIDGN